MKRVLWCITGAGGHLRDVFQALRSLRRAGGFELGVALSRAGEEVARIYGVLDRLDTVASGGRYGGVYKRATWSGVTENGVPLGGRVSLRRYDVVIVAPASSNTVAKIVHGVSDTLPTIVVSQALKARVPVLILPADQEETVTTLPCRIDNSACTYCLRCVEACPHNAVYDLPQEREVRIDYNRCRGCGECMAVCKPGAIRCWEKVTVTPSPIDLENVERLRKVQVRVVRRVDELVEELKSLLGL